ncbi:CRISPR-associated protein, NE0113 family [Allochromatium warmingii]|uniref:CRISPR-associated protein, NE0113 family n=1 Tax=Allochromatium warmingii TaxID=61595 RepID=A0A1H3HI07_ALLWA|nr:CRISPR-associated ring nuclease Csm6 [Allochromatium warmingii]SDY15081.1 CRISPR-associated protein, NE0113 family [Allochromatium warmingii]
MSEHTTPRRILLAVTGLTPQIVTETLYALACRADNPWIPHEIHLITTTTGANNARLNLLAGEHWFHRLCADYELPPITFTSEQIHVLQNAEGQPLDDIRTQADNTQAADCITETLRALTADPNSELHVSIAGGRKTMGYYLGYALSLYGRPQDRLSHVLVSDPYETNRNFYYPTPYEHPIHSPRGDKEVTVDARHALIDLADIPFVLLRDGLPERLRTGQTSFTRAVATANRGLQEPHLVLDVKAQRVWADDEEIMLSKTEFLILLWLAERAGRGERTTDWSKPEVAQEFLSDVAVRIFNPDGADYQRLEESLGWRIAKAHEPNEYFQPHKSNINKAFALTLGKRSAERYLIGRGKDNAFPLVSEQIEIVGV